jgi:hypothetical protein
LEKLMDPSVAPNPQDWQNLLDRHQWCLTSVAMWIVDSRLRAGILKLEINQASLIFFVFRSLLVLLELFTQLPIAKQLPARPNVSWELAERQLLLKSQIYE